MYPFVRMAKELFIHRNSPPLPVGGTHVSSHMCWPWDLDLWKELNNGRTLTLFDLGRIPLARRTGLHAAIRSKDWGLTVAGVSIRYRRRIRLFERVEMRSRIIGWDERFVYLDQTFWNQQGECTTQALYRTAVTSKAGIVPPKEVAVVMGYEGESPNLPGWVNAWIAAERERPWPPERAGLTP